MAFDFTGGAGTIKEKEKKSTGFDFTGGTAAKQVAPSKPKNVTPSKVPKVSAKEARMQELGRSAEPSLTNRDIFLLKQNQSPHMALARAILPDSWIKTDPRVEQLYQTWPQLREEIPIRKKQILPSLAIQAYTDLPTLLASYMTGGTAGVAAATAKVAPKAGTLAPKALQGLNLLQKEAARGIGAGATYGGVTAASEGKGPVETAKSMAGNALLFGAGDPAAVKGMQLAGKFVQGLKQPLNLPQIRNLDLRKPQTPKMLPGPKEQLALPPGSQGVIPEWASDPAGVVRAKGRTGQPVALPMTQGETAARERIKQRKGRAMSGLPVDDFIDYSSIGASKIAKQGLKFTDWSGEMLEEFGTGIKPYLRDIWAKSKDILERGADALQDVKPAQGDLFHGDPTKLRDFSGYRLNFSDVYRNFRDVFGSQYGQIKKRLLDPFDDAKKANVVHQEKLLTDLKKNVVDRLGIKKGSKESALVQMYGEGQISLNELKRRAPKKWQKIVEADQWFRKQYNRLLDEVNATRAEIYPTNPDKIIPKRKDYYRHFTELAEGFAALKNVFDTPSQIDPRLEGISEFTLPKTKWQSFAQKRLGGRFVNDAVGGYLNYVPAASYSIHIDPFIGQFERLAKELADNTAGSRNINNFIRYLNQFSQDLAGKTNPMDRWFQENIPGGRAAFQAINWLNNRIKANVILGNVGSALSQTANIPIGIAKLKQYSAPGAGKALASIFKTDKNIAKSGFIKERYGSYGSKMYRQFNTGMLSKPYNMAVWMLESADKLGTHFIWQSAYSKAVAQKMKDPIRYADNITREIVAGRGVGEVALNQKARTFQLIAPFQVEVANLWSIMRDMISAKDFGGLVLLALGNYMFNKAMEETRGSAVVFDPIQAMIDASKEGLSPAQRAGRVGGEVLSNVPLGQTVAALYPEYGLTAYDKKIPTRKELFGRQDPTRYGSSVLVAKGLQDPLAKIVAPFAGNQIKKTIEGQRAVEDTAVFSRGGDKLMYPVAPTIANTARGYAFGKYSFPEAREYFKKDRRPLSEKQTKQVLGSGNKSKTYERIQKQRKISSIKEKINTIKKDRNMSAAEKRKEINKLRQEWKQVSEGY